MDSREDRFVNLANLLHLNRALTEKEAWHGVIWVDALENLESLVSSEPTEVL